MKKFWKKFLCLLSGITIVSFEELLLKAQVHLGHQGAMISASKSGYRAANPKNLVIFNANVIVINGKEYSKIWYGDLDVTKSNKQLRSLAESLDRTVYVLREMDARFENEENPLIDKFAFAVLPDGKEILGDIEQLYFDSVSLEKIDK